MPLKITYISHATVLIEWDGVNILTDPVFSQRILCFRRKQPLQYDPAALPKLDAILLSHAHYDHLDHSSYKYIPGDVPILIPEGMSKAISSFVRNPVVELSTWSRFPLREGFEICTVPAKHPGGRFLIPYRYRKCHGYVLLRGEESLYFSGDTAYFDVFSDLKRLFKLKCAILDAAGTQKNWFRRGRHMDVDELIECWMDLGKPDIIPIHWGTFFVNHHKTHQLPRLLKKRAELNPELKEKLHLLEQGEFLEL